MRDRTPVNRGLATRRSIGLALAVCVLCVGTVARAVEVRLPAAGAELTWMPVSIEIAFDATADTGTLSVLLNGNDISGAFAFAPPGAGEIVATADDVWGGFVALGSNQIDFETWCDAEQSQRLLWRHNGRWRDFHLAPVSGLLLALAVALLRRCGDGEQKEKEQR